MSEALSLRGITYLDHLEWSLERRLQLLRGQVARWRGAQAGARFGLGRSVCLLYPSCFSAEYDVMIEDYSFLHCLSTRGVRIGANTSIGRNFWLHCGGTPSNFQHGFFEIGEHCFVGCNAVLGAGGGIKIGNNVLIGQSVNMHSENHRFSEKNRLIREQGVDYRDIRIEDDVWIGSQVIVLAGVMVGRGAVIGAGTIVTKSIPPYGIAVGVPARVIKARGVDAK